jgi:hypothetical protein
MKYQKGDVIKYELWGGDVREVTVTDRHEDVKNGQPGFDGIATDESDGWNGYFRYWGYDSQIISVKRGKR